MATGRICYRGSIVKNLLMLRCWARGCAAALLGLLAGCGAGSIVADGPGTAGADLAAPASVDLGRPPASDLASPADAAPDGAAAGLIFDDEFDGPAGSAVDGLRWVPDVGGGGFGNAEREYYTRGTDNAALDGSGHLAIVARKSAAALTCWYGRCLYTSARLKTQGLFAARYGRFEARLRIPAGQGLWPAFWLLGDDIAGTGWPGCGEIDVMENIGREPALVHGTVHGPGYSGGSGIGAPASLPGGADFASDFHLYAIEWTANEIRFSVDGAEYQRVTPASLPPGKKWVFDHPFFIIINLAVGGQWPGDPSPATVFPATLLVDYVRVYAR